MEEDGAPVAGYNGRGSLCLTLGQSRESPAYNGDVTPEEEDEETAGEDDSDSNVGTLEEDCARAASKEEERPARKKKEMKEKPAVRTRASTAPQLGRGISCLRPVAAAGEGRGAPVAAFSSEECG